MEVYDSDYENASDALNDSRSRELAIDNTDTPRKTKRRYSLPVRRSRHGTKHSARLAKNIVLQIDGNRAIQIAANEKVNIMFNFENKHCIHRRKDGTIAVVEDASFQQDKPPTLFDGNKHKEQLRNARVVLIYAVSRKDQESVDKRGVELQKRDVILILAQSSRYVVGITFDKEVGIFESSLLTLITEPRTCISDGMILNMCGSESFVSKGEMKSVKERILYQISKASEDLFKWFDIEDQRDISLHCLIEVTVLQDSGPPHHRTIRSMKHAEENYAEIDGIWFGDTKLSHKLKEPLPQPHLKENRNLHTDISLQFEPWFHGNLSRQQAVELLRNDGDFLVRHKSGRPWEYVISFKHNGVANHMELLLQDGCYKTHGGKFKSVRMVVYEHWNLRCPLSTEDKTIRLINPVYRDDVAIDTADNPELNEDYSQPDSDDSYLDDWKTSKEKTRRMTSSLFRQRVETLESSGVPPKQTKQCNPVISVETGLPNKHRWPKKTEEDEFYEDIITSVTTKAQDQKNEGDSEYLKSYSEASSAESEVDEYDDIDPPCNSGTQQVQKKEGDNEYLKSYSEASSAKSEEGDNEYLQSYCEAPLTERKQWTGASRMDTSIDSLQVEMGSKISVRTIFQQLDAVNRHLLLLLNRNVRGLTDVYDETYVETREEREYATHIPGEQRKSNQSTPPVPGLRKQLWDAEMDISVQRNRDSHQEDVGRKDTVRAMTQRLEATGLGLPQSEDLYDETYIEKTWKHEGLPQTTDDTNEQYQNKLLMQSFDRKSLPNAEFSSLMRGSILHNVTYMECFVDENGGDIVMPSSMVRVSIPPNALTSGEIIGITLFNDNRLGMNKGPRVCPVISLDPDDLQFKLPVEVSIAHCGIIGDTETVEATVYIGRFNEDNHFLWEELNSRCTFKNKFCQFTLDHFCLIDIDVGVKGKKIKVIPMAERMLLGEDLLMSCWMLNSNSTQDVKEELRNDVSPSTVILDTFQEFVILQTKQPLHCNVRSHNEQWTPVTMEQLLPFRQVWHSSRASFKFRHIVVSEMPDEQTPLDFTFEFKQLDNHEIVFHVRTKLEDLLRSQENTNYAETPEEKEDILLFTLARRMDERDCMRIATYYNLPPEALDYIKGKKEIGVALFKELRKRNFYNNSSLKGLTTALRDINLSLFASQIETIFPKRVNMSNSNVEVPDDFGKLKVIISDGLSRDQCMHFLTLWDLTASFKATLERDDTPGIALLCELERLGLFGKNKLGEVCQVFRELNFNHLIATINSYRQGTPGVVTKASFSLRRLLRVRSR